MQEKLLTVFYDNENDAVTIHEYIASIERLDELVAVQQSVIVCPAISKAIYINENRIHIRPDWLDIRPALLFPSEIPFNKNYFLGTIFGLLGSETEYPKYFISFPAMLFLFDLMQDITHGEIADGVMEKFLKRTAFAHPFENYAFNHNVAVALNYGHFSNEINGEAIEAHYKDALELAFEPSLKAYTLKYYALYLMDNGDNQGAMDLVKTSTIKTDEKYATYALKKVWCQAALKTVRFPFDFHFMETLKEELWDTLQFYENEGHDTIAAALWMDAATIASLSNSHAESLGYINKAVNIFREEEQHELLAQAELTKGRIFFDWAQSGNPQFYRSSLESYQKALTIFKKEEAPEVFADIHQQLGIIYAELPDENKKRSIWAALAVTSFQEALAFYNKVDHPYQFGTLCNNFGNAYTKFPVGGKTDNFEKALNYYEEALSVRDAKNYPNERAVTLVNYLEASWKAGNEGEDFNMVRFEDMAAKANEIPTLTHDRQLLVEVEKHLQMLQHLEEKIKEEN